ncbi:RNA polymerase factor sigma-54 [Lentibacillus sp. L22]|uniref:RNA polymerase factor sigma-54 n=1 Tax=Lentibacillus TaxID=175304 RepID=UPI0022B19C3F|nr:RNA polymerase factor sigma-54 [Lentibacillus daqui]
MELVLQQKQSLNLVMTTELRQAIQLLQYSTYELYQFIQDQQMENPLIELEEKVPDNPYPEKSYRSVNNNNDHNPFDFIPEQEQGMREQLLEQVQWLDVTESERDLLHYLILNLDENGYLPLNTAEIAEDISVSETVIDKGVELLQQLEPIGVGARNLQECLLLQARYYYPDQPVLECLISEYLDDLANKKWQDIAKYLNISLADVKQMSDIIQQFDPKPCARINNSQADYLHPDIVVEQKGDGFSVYLNDGYLPHIRLNPQYAEFLTSKNEAASYMQNKYKSYQWLVNSLEQRRSTILKIVDVIIRRQHDFLLHGFSALKPLTLKDVAEEIDMHESTVSRATMNKVIQTPQGAYDVRRLFASGLTADNGDSASQATVKLLLKDLVGKENKQKPYSDQKIADYFKTKKGITISRRTVAKYREELKIPSSSRRKEIEV